MTVVIVRQSDKAPNLRFSRNATKHGPPPCQVRVGHELLVVFKDPSKLVSGGVFVDPRVRDKLVANIPGFKRALPRKSRVVV